jgi:hypothetical protein
MASKTPTVMTRRRRVRRLSGGSWSPSALEDAMACSVTVPQSLSVNNLT